MINQCVMVGRAGKDPETFTFDSGNNKTTITMACERPTKKKEVDWFTVEAWGKQAEVLAQYVKKGHVFGAVGSVHIEEFEHNGQQKKKVVIAANQIRLMQPKDESQQGQQQQQQPAQDVFAAYANSGQQQLPF